MFKRKAVAELEKWAKSKWRKPLILRGARQVGKTTIVKQFSQQFDNFLPLNLEKRADMQLMESTDNVKTLLPMIFLYCGVSEKKGRTLVFLDEIQNSPKTVTLLRYFYEELPEIYVIAAGSLLETMLGRNISIPVGRVDYLALRPCSFTEFMGAIGEESYTSHILDATLPDAFHEHINTLFNTYALVGGMPEIVARYAEDKNVIDLSATYRSLINSYKNDAEKYADGITRTNVIRHIIEQGWNYAGQTITLGNFAGSQYKAREVGEALRILEKTMLCELVYPTTSTLPPGIQELRRSPKLIWLDMGLVNYNARIQKEYLLSKNLKDVWRGMAAEQIVAQALLALDTDVDARRKFWVREKKGSNAEVDFVYEYDGMLIPVEVKSGHNAHLKSLHIYMDEAPHDIAIRIWSNPFSIDDVLTGKGKPFKLINLPFYYIEALPKILKQL